MSDFAEKFTEKLKAFLHDSIDKCFDIPKHEERAKKYAEIIDVSGVSEFKGPDMIASCMERSLLPKKLTHDFDEIKHPLCDSFLKLTDTFDIDEISKDVENVYNEIKNETSQWDDKKRFFYLWRNLQDLIFEKAEDKNWVKYLSILPADTRVPDHSIWEHLKIASAVSAYLYNKNLIQNNSLFLFTIGPVQGFIKQARKTQDFYMGSFMLSFLTFKAMEVILDEFGPTNIIYPDLYKQPLMDWWIKRKLKFDPIGFHEEDLHLPTIPNRFVAILPTTDEREIKCIADKMKEKIYETIHEALRVIFKELNIQEALPKNVKGEEIKRKITAQIGEFPEIYWVAVPWKIEERDLCISDLDSFFSEDVIKKFNDLWEFATEQGNYLPNVGLIYELLYSLLERFMGARKNIRTFKQSELEEKGRKCSVCGERDVIFFRETQNKNKFTRYNQYLIDLTYNPKVSLKFLADGEGLCAICFLKRTFEIYLEKEVSDIFKDLSFPSTAEVASSDFKSKMLSEVKEEYKDYLEHLKSLGVQPVKPLKKLEKLFEDSERQAIVNLEGAWFYEENLNERYIREQLEKQVSSKELQELRKTLNGITKKIGKPNSYYAIIYLDGDHMGKWLSGEKLPEIEHAYASDTWNELPQEFKENLSQIRKTKPLTPAIHASISNALRNYALEFVRKIVEEEHLGKLVYAGGDDVLAFVNLRDLLDVMHKLRWAFSGQIKLNSEGEIEVDLENKIGFVEKDGRYLLTMGTRASASMGVVVAHYKAPLKIVLDKVFEMQKLAKEKGRDGFAICLMRRAGEERVAQAKWLYEDKDTMKTLRDTMKTLKDLVEAFDEKNSLGYISKSFIQKIAKDFIHLRTEDGKLNITGEIFNVELLRYLERSYIPPKGKKLSNDEKKQFISGICKKMKDLFWDTGENLDNFVNLLTTLTFIHKAEE
ncbi:MAG: type III-B CRISPR-associated protein Cas10/Cmr2 [Caldimicrobium sp.]|nr:type III-B CRISPR-associated protein Cas10/Cmr2 [Caldimicrobium sp.]